MISRRANYFLILPPMNPHQINKAATSQVFLDDISLFPGCLDKFLAESVPHRDDKSAAIRKLVKKGLGDFGRTGRNNDGIVGLIFLPSEG
ncbi:MAG: hypothetical protein WBB73_14335, partial [Candidatus Aminicenantaceae bacterium]